MKLKKCIFNLLFVSIFSMPVVLADYQSIYNEAWDIAGKSFYDSTMNHQDWTRWKKHYSGRIKTQEDLEIAIESMLASLDERYTRYLPKIDFSEEHSDIHDEQQSLYTKTRYFRTRIPKDIKYLRIDSMMNKNLTEEVKNFIEESEKDKNLKGYIIDLRDNGGGLVKNASDIASLFMNDKIVLYAKTNSRDVKNTTKPDGCMTTKPVVILVDENTASACEVFTGAMRDNDRAYVIGTTSFGKGVIQKIFKLSDDSGVHVTVMAYYTPKWKEINKKGIKPDEEVFFTRKDVFFHKDVQLLRALKYVKSLSTQHLSEKH